MVRPNRKTDQVLLLRDNTPPHTSPRTRQAITTTGWTVLPPPPYTPDLAPSDYNLFGPVKDALGRTTSCVQPRAETQCAWRAPTLQLNFTSAYSVSRKGEKKCLDNGNFIEKKISTFKVCKFHYNLLQRLRKSRVHYFRTAPRVYVWMDVCVYIYIYIERERERERQREREIQTHIHSVRI